MSSKFNLFDQLGLALKSLHREGKYSDAILIVKEKEFPVHRYILASQSLFFDRLLYHNPFEEGQSNEKIKIDACPVSFEMILKFLYSGEMDLKDKNIGDVYDILELAHRFDLSHLEAALLDRMSSLTDLSNVHWSIRAANLFESAKLMKKCVNTLNDDQPEFLAGDGYLKMSQAEIIEILSCEELIWTMIEKFQMIEKWVNANPDGNKHKLLATVDISLLSNRQIKQIVAPAKLFDDSYLKDFIWSREMDVSEEPPSHQNYGLPALGSKITVRRELIILDLGQVRVINCLKFNLADRKSFCSYSIKFSTLNTFSTQQDLPVFINWTSLRTFEGCRGTQTIYFEPTAMRLVCIQGANQYEDFGAFKIRQLPELQNYFIVPKENVLTPRNAIVTNGLVSSLALDERTWSLQDTACQTTFSRTSTSYMAFWLNHPYFLRNFRFQLYEFAELQQSFEVTAYDSEWNKTVLEPRKGINGWYTVDLQPKAYLVFQFESTDCTELRVIHVEATG